MHYFNRGRRRPAQARVPKPLRLDEVRLIRDSLGSTYLPPHSSSKETDERLDAWRKQPLLILSRLTPESRGWVGFSAELFEGGGRTSGNLVLPRHQVMMLVGAPINTTVSCDDNIASCLQLPGTFNIYPARSSFSCMDAGPSAFFTVGLEHSLLCETAYSMGMKPEHITLEHQLTCRDPQIEHIMLALKAELELDQPGGSACVDSLAVALATQLLRRWVHPRGGS